LSERTRSGVKRRQKSAGSTLLAALEAATNGVGLKLRGYCPLQAEDGLGTGTLILIGNVGPEMWRAYRREMPRHSPNPLDRWSRDTINGLADAFQARSVFPFDGPPWWPFQRWARRAEAVYPSPLGALIHPRYGTWHAYRGALVLHDTVLPYASPAGDSPCSRCTGKPCLQTCPVEAITEANYDVAACRRHVRSVVNNDCLGLGCRARRACPVGRDYTYSEDQAAHHMRYFADAI
jgi:hypothetical protein